MPALRPLPNVRQWIWRAFARSTLLPLILVEAVLIGAYLLGNDAIRRDQIAHMQEIARYELQTSVQREARDLDRQLEQVASLTERYRHLVTQALSDPSVVTPTEPEQGSPAASEPAHLEKAARLVALDPLLKVFQERLPLILSIRFTSQDHYTHIYPERSLAESLTDPQRYAVANATLNPQRWLLWSLPQRDPIDNSWVVSAMAPVYQGDVLAGVVSIDISLDRLLAQLDSLEMPWASYPLLIDNQQKLVELSVTHLQPRPPERLPQQLPTNTSLNDYPLTQPLARAMTGAHQGLSRLEQADHPQLVAWTRLAQTDWILLMLADENQVLQQTNHLATRYQHIGYLMIAGLLLFYVALAIFLWQRARQLSQRLLQPITGISQMMAQIGQGNWYPERIEAHIHELQQMVEHTARVGEQLQQSDQQRDQAQRHLELVLENATDSLWEYTPHNSTLLLRGRFCERFGLPNEPLALSRFLDHVHPHDLPRLQACRALIESSHMMRDVEFRLRTSDGHYHWVLGRGRQIANDTPAGSRLLTGTLVDIDALKRTEADLRQAILEARTASLAQARFLSGISHELRTPLNAIHGFAQLMQLEHNQNHPGQKAEYLDEIMLDSTHLNQLINDVLDWASLQASKPRLELKPIQIAQLMAECADLIQPEAHSLGLHITVRLPVSTLRVQGDTRRLRQILLNLLSNAVKYNRPQGRLELYADESRTDHLNICVEDTGLGIEPGLQSRLFEPFQRLGRERTAIPGTGIGLALCREFATQMRGRIGVRSQPGQGSCFWIELPYATHEATQPTN